MWWGKRWETSFWTCVPFSKAIAATTSWSVLCIVVHCLPQGHRNKWVRRLSMVWSHWHHERWTLEGCGKLRWVRSDVRKWAGDRRKIGVVRRTNNQALALKPAYERRCVHMIFEGMFVKSKANSYSCRWSTKEAYNWDKTEPLGFQSVGPESRQLGVTCMCIS
jgi:hypothetical protein